ncbi:MAG: LCCL domain-containing protein [Acidobacteriota bacterium]
MNWQTKGVVVSSSFQSKQKQCHQRLITGSWALLFLAALTFAGCSKLKNDNGGGGHTGTSSDNTNPGPSSSAPASSTAGATPTTWQANATSLNGAAGQTFTLACSPEGAAHSVWGSDIYTSDSSICTAGVHSGLITYQQGGTVTIEMRPGRPIYGCSERNGVTSSPYGSYLSSFVFKTPDTEAIVREADEQTPVLWNTSATMVSGDNGKTYKFKCPANGREGAVWGTDIYTIDSSICNAAVHSGKLTMESGGSVTIELRPGETAYKGSSRNGIKTNDYGAYGRSFVVK